MIFGQEDIDGRLLVLGELVPDRLSARPGSSELLKPYLRRRFP
jgi:hypothetical protein